MFKKGKPLKKPGDVDHAYDYALFLLNLSMRTEQELREKMQKRGYYPEIIDAVVTRLFSDRYLDDERYAEVYINSMKQYKYYGAFMMKKRLYEKKVPKEIISEKLVELMSTEDEESIATRYVEKKFGLLAEIAKYEYEERQKIMRRLLSRGFRLDLAKKIVGV